MELSLQVNNNLLIAHTLQSNKYSDLDYKKDVISFKSKAWDISQSAYNIIAGRALHPDQYNSDQLLYLPLFLETVQKTDEFVTDEKMRTRLNGSSYPDYVGHTNLAEIKDRIFEIRRVERGLSM